MPAKIDTNLLPPVIRDSVDPEILDRAQSIEWSIARDTGEHERGFVDGSHEDYLSSQNLMYKSHSGKQVDWLDNLSAKGGRDSGFEQLSPGTPSLNLGSNNNLSGYAEDIGYIGSQASGNRHPKNVYPFPIYKVNQEQLHGDVFFEKAPKARPGERTIHYEKSSRIMKEHDLEALGLDPKTFPANSNTCVDEQQEETIETSLFKGGPDQLRQLVEGMRNEAGDYFDRERARNNGTPLDGEDSMKRTVIFGSLEELNNRDQEYFPYRDAHQGKPLPGDNEYGTWGSRRDEERQWKLCNGQWVRIAEPKPAPPEPEREQYVAEQVKCTILLRPPVEEIKCEPIKPTYVEMKKPLKHEGEEEKMMEDPNLMWIGMGPAQYGPPFGTLKKRKAREEEWVGPPCELCHKQIEERRCMLAENRKFHCWHFACSFCLKTLKPADFLIAEADKKPYCLNCHKREFPEISLVHLNLEE